MDVATLKQINGLTGDDSIAPGTTLKSCTIIQNYISGSLRRKTFQAFLFEGENMQVAIDGTSFVWKSDRFKIDCEETELLYPDTGAMYRATTWHF